MDVARVTSTKCLWRTMKLWRTPKYSQGSGFRYLGFFGLFEFCCQISSFLGPGRVFFQGLRRFPEFGGGFRNMGGDSFVFSHHPTQRGCLIFTALTLKRLPTWPLVKTKLTWPIRSQDLKTSINSILPHTYLYLQWIVMPCYDHSRPGVQEVYQIRDYWLQVVIHY